LRGGSIFWLYGTAFITAVVIVALGGMLWVRRSVAFELLESHNEVAGFIYAVVGVIYAVLLAFVVAFVWEQHELAQTRVEQEASELGDLFRDTEAFPQAVRRDLQERIRHYVGTVQDLEWQAMVRGEPSAQAWGAFNELWQAYVAYVPDTAQARSWYEETIADLNEVGNFRRLRLLSSRATVPVILWVTLLVGGAITIGFSYFFGAKSLLAHAMMVAAVSTITALILFVILALNHPFGGLAPVTPEAFEQLMMILDTWSRLP
jgi:hypothetical protein